MYSIKIKYKAIFCMELIEKQNNFEMNDMWDKSVV